MRLGWTQGSVWRRVCVAFLLVVGLAALAAAGPVAAQESAAPAAAAELMKSAPTGAWVAGAVDIKRLLATPLLAPLQMRDPEFGQKMQGIDAAVLFVLPMDPPLDNYPGPLAYGLVRLGDGKRQVLEEELAGSRMDEDIAGLPAYAEDRVVLVFLDDATMLLGPAREIVAVAVDHCRQGPGVGLTGDLKEILAPHSNRMLYAGVAMPVPFRQMVSDFEAENAPEWVGDLTGGAVSADLTTGLELRLHLRFATAEAAQEAAEQTSMRLAETRERLKATQGANPMMAASMGPMAALLDKPKVTTAGPDFRVSLDLTQPEMQALQGAIMMPMMMMAPAMGKARAEAQKARSMSNLHNIGLGIMMARLDNDDQFPANLAAVFDAGYIEDDGVLVDPSDSEPEVDPQSGRRCSYRYVGEVPPRVPPGFIICYSRKGIRKGSRLVLYADMAVQELSEEDLHESNAARGMSLGDCYKWAAANWPGGLTQDADARLRKFFEVEG